MIYSQDWNVMTYLQKFKAKPQQTNKAKQQQKRKHQPTKKSWRIWSLGLLTFYLKVMDCKLITELFTR